MMYSESDKLELGTMVLRYLINLEYSLQQKLNDQLILNTIQTSKGQVKIDSINGSGRLIIDFRLVKLHELLSGKSILISGKFVQEIMEDIDGNIKMKTNLEINFNETEVKYNFETETFDIPNNLNITYFSKE